MHSTTIERIATGRVIAIIRGDYGDRIEEIAAAILDAGVTALEVTFNSPNVLASIERLSAALGSRMAIGAGTVLTREDVDAAARAGARFIVSPNMNPDVIRATRERDLVSLPGCFTPTEIVAAIDAGADAAKLFPASALGVEFVRALRGPLPAIRVVPTGGVTPEMAHSYFAAGAWAVGVGSELISRDALAPGGLERLRQRAAAFAAALA
ncbi:MAG: bifunctional 4-hydroxy-2-oxoglutarate aldolase/2-dehydro-3-deoxy-phosphogluconate aldolase [Blastocatellia bacterium]|nr:bifunctional 4-hydroxy-2-oxoglutarate aldolase/2-dehydro-3-deoxy-phosphogluconate aldolase [Blastocatellia bacterium]